MGTKSTALKAVLFDFDGTISTLRAGWETVMAPFMLEEICGKQQFDEKFVLRIQEEINRYIDQSTGIQTIFQMKWLVEKVRDYGLMPVRNEWDYKAEYNRRLLAIVEERIREIREGRLHPNDYLIKGSRQLLDMLRDKGMALYLASGTDHQDVVNETKVLGVYDYFKTIAGAPPGRTDCSKESVLRNLLEEQHYQGRELAIIGDGKVEIRLGRECGALSLGLASDEAKREGLNPFKVGRLQDAGAYEIAGDFSNLDRWRNWLGL